MEAIQQLNHWFTDKDYFKGVAIYKELGFSQVLKNLFTKGPNKYNTAKLEAELTKLHDKHVKTKPVVAKTVRTKIVQKNLSKIDNSPLTTHHSPPTYPPRYTVPNVNEVDFDKLPDQLKYETTIRIKLFKEAEAHHYRLDSLTDAIEKQKSVDLILANFEQIDNYWTRIDYWLEHGIVLPTDVDKTTITEVTDPFEMVKRRNNLRSNITKSRKKVLLLSDTTKIANINQKIAHWEIELADLDEKIKNHG